MDMGRKSSCRDDTNGVVAALLLAAALCLGAAAVARGQLTDDFYDDCCPQAEDIVKARVSAAMRAEARMGASLLRLHFHDCFVNVRRRASLFRLWGLSTFYALMTHVVTEQRDLAGCTACTRCRGATGPSCWTGATARSWRRRT